MAIDKIRQNQNRQAAQIAQEKQKAKEEERLWKQRRLEDQEKNRPVLEYLIELESFFWECASDFSSLAGLGIKSRNRSWLYPLRATPTAKEPRLHVYFTPPNEYFAYNEIELEASYRLEFYAHCPRLGNIGGTVPTTYHGEVREFFRVESFDIQSAHDWLEKSLERYYGSVQSLKSYR